MLNAVLKVVGGKQDGKLIPLGTKKFLIGREHDCHLRPNSESVSRHHCVITIDDFALRVRDLGSSNGTYLNGTRIIGAQAANNGDRLTVGGLEFELQFVGEEAAAPASDAGGTEFSLNDVGLEEAEPMAETAVMSGDTAVIPQKEELVEQPLNDAADPAQPAEGVPAAAPAAEAPAQAAPPPEAQPDPAQQALAAQQAAAAQQQQMMPQQPYPGMPQQPYPGMPQQPGYGMPQPGYGMPQPYPGMPPQPGYGMPQPGYGMPQQPGYGMPQPGYPQYPQQQPPMGYPAAPQPQYAPVEEEDEEDEPEATSVAEPMTQLPDPAETGFKEPEPSAEEEKKDGAPKPAAPNPAEEVLKKYMNRR